MLNQTFDNDLDETRSTDPKSSSRLSQQLSPQMNDFRMRETQQSNQMTTHDNAESNYRKDDPVEHDDNNLLSKGMLLLDAMIFCYFKFYIVLDFIV